MKAFGSKAKLGVAAAICASLALPAGATAERIVPPDNSAANQYTETYPTTGGGSTQPEAGGRTPAQALGPSKAKKLEQLGPEGRAAAALAAATAPDRQAAGSGTGRGRTAGGGSGGGGAKVRPGTDVDGSSGFGEVLGQATGSSTSGQMGLLLPVLVLAAIAGSLIYLWRRKRQLA
jgi:hypothetical protein